MLEGGLRRRTPHTICDPAELVRELREVRHSGVAFEREECLIGRACVASAILSLGAVAVAAICVAGTPADVAHDRVAPAVRSAAKTLGHRLDLHRPTDALDRPDDEATRWATSHPLFVSLLSARSRGSPCTPPGSPR